MDALAELMKSNQLLAERTGAMLRGELAAPDVEGPNMNEHQTALRLPVEMLERADALAERLRKDPTLAAVGQLSRSAVLRLAIARGLDVLEREQGIGKAKK